MLSKLKGTPGFIVGAELIFLFVCMLCIAIIGWTAFGGKVAAEWTDLGAAAEGLNQIYEMSTWAVIHVPEGCIERINCPGDEDAPNLTVPCYNGDISICAASVAACFEFWGATPTEEIFEVLFSYCGEEDNASTPQLLARRAD